MSAMEPRVSIIIPTYNRPTVLRRLLRTLDLQDYPAGQWEVLVVDDGSPGPETQAACQEPYRFSLRFLQQKHGGAANARNLGAEQSRGAILIFLDDDIVVDPGFITALAAEHARYDRAVLMGAFVPPPNGHSTPFHTAAVIYGIAQDTLPEPGDVEFIHVVSHNLSIKRAHFFEIGCFQDPTDGKQWPNWDDIDIAYRAYQAGFVFRRVAGAGGSHIDYALDDFQAHCKRMNRAGRSAIALFAKFPELVHLLPMFHDKTPIRPGDPPRLVVKKILRAVTAWEPALALMETLKRLLERKRPNSPVLRQLYRWITSSYIYNGYRHPQPLERR